MALNSRSHSEKYLSAYLGELKTIQRVLSEIKPISAGMTVNLFTDSQSSALRRSDGLQGGPGMGVDSRKLSASGKAEDLLHPGSGQLYRRYLIEMVRAHPRWRG